jgi:hypothetical protein
MSRDLPECATAHRRGFRYTNSLVRFDNPRLLAALALESRHNLRIAPLERCDEIAHLALSFWMQRVDVIQKELTFNRQPPGVHQCLAAPFSIALRNNCELH